MDFSPLCWGETKQKEKYRSEGEYIYLFLCQPVEEPEKMTQIIVEALEITKQRGIINKGWGGLGDCKSYLPF